MKHNIFFPNVAWPLLAALAMGISACSDYQDEYGCEASLTLQFDGYSNYSANSFDANFTIDVTVGNLNGETIEEAGIMTVLKNGTQTPYINRTYPVEAMRGITGGTFQATVPSLQYNVNYTFRPYLKTATTTMIGLSEYVIADVRPVNMLTINELSEATLSDDCVATITVTLNDAEFAKNSGYTCGLEITKAGDSTPHVVTSSYPTVQHSFSIGHLSPGTYTYRAYLNTENAGRQYANLQKQFTIDGAIDLGLSVKWAACNLSTNNYDAAIEGDLYRFPSRRDQVKIPDSEDMATKQWGSGWRLPTTAEATELINSCTWEFTQNKEKKKGWRVTGPNGRSIFLPMRKTRFYQGTFLDTSTWYWLSDNAHISTSPSFKANTWVNNVLYLSQAEYSINEGDDLTDKYQLPVRAVTNK